MEDDGNNPSAFNYQCNSIITQMTKAVQTNCNLGLDSHWIPTLLGVLLQLLL
ncbi:hypothetical protein PCANC_22589 [Puccinia coronata f. sp. avenae]|uniref:Uncharacterized protein n=1 Tax=Puccinia coronata f. sp. avenae TaxID=200324 RepID=A0A2N5SM68_9BASI|nr:hypothetical protein PCANC_22589 [Puccinia coronata f. sp. avenae]PLW33468.1 hypothetical protein PCASD_14395 [Puccinia coronata f. sp. avenae]